MEMYVIWLIIAVVFTVLEICTTGFAVLCFGIGAVFAAVASSFSGLTGQMVAFVIGSALSFVLVRPFVLRFLTKRQAEVKTNADALVGKRAIVSETIDVVEHSGRVAIDGDDWKAVSEDGSRIEKGQTVEVVSRDSIVLTVRK
ncbi:MAG: NfeD family protein [Paludibacteraceae bacterium]|nr:NfeD family protein [Paludibacteraceae bacterium]